MVTSNQSGPWSVTNSWVGGVVPTASDEVAIQQGHSVSVDVTTATCSTLTVRGTLAFSRAQNATLTLAGGDMTVAAGGTLDMGTPASPIPIGVQAQLILAHGFYAGQYGLIVDNGGNFSAHGATKAPFGMALGNVAAGAAGLSVSGEDGTGWATGDRIAIGATQLLGPNSTEIRTLTGASGGSPQNISWSGGDPLWYLHLATGPTVVANLTRNVVIRSSGTLLTNPNGNSAFIRTLTTSATGFHAAHSEFVYLGGGASGIAGLTLEGSAVKVDLSSCVFRDGFTAIRSSGASNQVYERNVFYAMANFGIDLGEGSSFNRVERSAVVLSGGVNIASGSNSNRIQDNYFVSATGVVISTASLNAVYSNTFIGANGTAVHMSAGAGFGNWISSNTGSSQVGFLERLNISGYATHVSSNFNFSIHVFAGARNTIVGNRNCSIEGEPEASAVLISSNAASSIHWRANFSIIEFNAVVPFGIRVLGSSNTIARNTISGASYAGINVVGHGNVLADNITHSNGALSDPDLFGGGIVLEGSSNTLISNLSFSNSVGIQSIANFLRPVNLVAESRLGVDASGALAPNTLSDIRTTAGPLNLNPSSVILKNVQTNTAVGVSTAGLVGYGRNYISFNENLATGTVRVYGDYGIDGTTLTLDFAAGLYPSTATPARVVFGDSVTGAAVNSTSDNAAVTQSIRITYQSSDALWHVVGAVSGELGTLPPGGGTADFPSGTPQFNLTLSASGALDGDRVDFALVAASGDAGRQKKLLFGRGADEYRGGRSQLTVAPSGGLVLRGTTTLPTVTDRIDAAVPYYSLVSSGAFSAAYASMTNMDSSGLQLSGSAGVLISTSVFDFMGVVPGITNCFITLNGLTSRTTIYSTTFATSRSTAGASPARNVRVVGANPGLEWYFRGKGGGLWGEAFEEDSSGRVVWWDRPPSSAAILAVQASSIVAGWGQVFPDFYEFQAATASNFTGAIASSVTFATSLTTLAVTGLGSNTTWYLRVGASFVDVMEYAALPTTVTLAKPVIGAGIGAVFFSSVAVNWVPLPTAAQEGSSNSAQGYVLQASTRADFSGLLFSSATANVQVSTLVIAGLTVDVTYFFRIGSLNWRGVPNFLSAGLSAIPAPEVPSSLQANAVFQTSATLSWSAGANPGGTRYEISASTDGFSLQFSTPVEFSSNLTAATTGFSGLVAGTTYQFRVRAQSPGGIQTAFAPFITTVTAPGGVAAPVGVALGISSIAWTWANAGPAASYRLTRPATGALVTVTTAPVFLETGLPTDTASGLRVEPFTATASGGLSPPTTRFTHAEAPNGPFIGALEPLVVAWFTGSNPFGVTIYEVSASTDDFVANTAVVVPVSSATTNPAAVVNGLAPGTTWWFRVRAVNGDGLFSGFSESVATQTVPGAVASLAGTALGVSSVGWSWAATAGPTVTSYDVFRASNGAFLGSAAGTAFADTGLSTNAAYGIAVRARNGSGVGPLSAGATAFTAAAPPTTTAVTGVFASSVALSWSANTNPAGTVFDVQRSTDNVSFSAAGSVVSATHVVTGLTGPATYYFRVRAVNGESVATAFASGVSTFVFGTPPSPPVGLAAASAGSLRIRLDWGPSPSTSVVRYNLYFDSGTGTIDYAAPLSTFTASATTFLSAPLTTGVIYKFGLRAQDNLGQEERNTSVQAAAAALASLTGVRAVIRAPAGGLKVAGDRLTVLAELAQGTPATVREVRFQFKASTAAVWTDIDPMTTHANPDTSAPYYVHWNVGNLASSDHDLRAVAVDTAGTADGAPASVTVRVDPADFDLREFAIAGSRIQKEQRIFNSVANTLNAADSGSGMVTKVVIPAGALAAATGTVTVVNNSAAVPADGTEVHGAGVAVEISLSGGQTALAGGNLAVLTFTYADADDNGVLDGTTIRADSLVIHAYDPATTKWRKEAATTRDAVNRTVSATTSHFSFFGAFVPAHADLASVRVYPNPYKPNNASADDGTPYSPGSPNSGVIFDNLPAQVTVKIFTVSAQLVRELSSGASGGRVQWDAKNDRGADVASGGYFAVINSPGQKAVVKRLGIVR